MTGKPQKYRQPGGKSNLESIFRDLSAVYGDPKTELTYETPFQLLIAVVLSAQCTDARVNLTTPALFAAYPSPEAMAVAPLPALEKLIHSCGFYRAKAKSIRGAAEGLVQRFAGVVPQTLDELVSLPGVGRKTASVVLNQAFDLPAIAVDTHVARVSQRLGWAQSDDPIKIERELMALVPQNLWATVNGLLILHGRRLCKARKPLCDQCPVRDRCPYFLGGAFLAGKPVGAKAAKAGKKKKKATKRTASGRRAQSE